HTRQRRLSQPAFHRQRIGAYGAVMTEHAARLCESWREGREGDLWHDMMALAMSIVGRALFGLDIGGGGDEGGRRRSPHTLPLSHRSAPPSARTLQGRPLPSTRRFERARGRLDEIIYGLIAERRRSGRDHGDLLSMLLMATDEEGDGRGMSDTQL